jgi:hypothetical protein
MEQLVPIIAIGVLATLLIVLVVGLLVPRRLRRQEIKAAEEATRLREMMLDVLSEQEAVHLRQAQLGSSLLSMREQIEHLAGKEAASLALSREEIAEAAGVSRLEQRLDALREQLEEYAAREAQSRELMAQTANTQRLEESRSWAHLLGLLATMQDHIASLNEAVMEQPQANQATDHLLQELDAEMQSMRTLADEIAGIQWRLRRSILERETSLASLRAQVLKKPKVGHRAA